MNCFSESDSFDMVDIVTMESRLDFVRRWKRK